MCIRIGTPRIRIRNYLYESEPDPSDNKQKKKKKNHDFSQFFYFFLTFFIFEDDVNMSSKTTGNQQKNLDKTYLLKKLIFC